MRNRKRTLLTSGVIAAAVFVFLSLDSHLASMDEMAYDNIIDFETAHIQITTSQYWEEKDDLPLKKLLSHNRELQSAIEQTSDFLASSIRLDFQARLNDGREELPVTARAIEEESFRGIMKINDYIIQGSFFKPGEKKALLGKELAEDINLTEGDYFTLVFRTKDNFFNTLELQVKGLFHSPNPDINKNIVFLPLETAQEALNAHGEISHLMIRLKEKKNTEKAAGFLKNKLAEFQNSFAVVPWYELEAVGVSEAKNMGNQLILTIILLIAAIGIINSVILSALERMHETGMMKAMGVTEKSIVFIYIIESAGIAILGIFFGSLAASGAITYLSKYGIDYSFLWGELGRFGIPIIGPIYGVWVPESFLFISIFCIIVAVSASLPPSIWAARKDAVETIHRKKA